MQFAFGLVLASIAAALVLSFHNGLPEPRLPGGGRLQYDTLWVLLLDGLALLLYAVGWRGVAKICAAATMAISSLCIIAHVLPQAIATRPLLADPWLAGRQGDYTAMGVPTALVALLLGAALALVLPAAQRSAVRTVALACLASTVLALSLLLAFGAWSGSSLAAQSLQLEADERIDALIFMALGATVLIYSFTGSASERIALGRFAPAMVGLSVFVAVLVVWRAALSQEARYVQGGSQLIAASAASAIERDLLDKVNVLERLADRMSIHTFNAGIWQEEGASILRNEELFRTVSWSGPDYVIRWAAPPDPALIGYDILSDPVRGAVARQSTAIHQTTLTHFTSLRVGGRGVIVFVPSYDGQEWRGTVSSALGSSWLASVIGDRFPYHQFELLERDRVEQLAAVAAPKADGEWAVEVPVTVFNAQWRLRATPTRAYVEGARSQIPEAGLALGTTLSLLLGLATYFYQAARRRARALNLANERLIEDNARREVAEQRLRETERNNQLIVDAVKDCAIYMLGNDGRIVSWNRGAHSLTGYGPRETIGRHYSMLYPAEHKTLPDDGLAVAARVGWFEAECWHLRKDGTRYRADDVISPIRNDRDEQQGFAVITRDATLRIALREQTERARDHYLSLFSSFPNLVWQSDPSGACDYVNQAWLDYTGRGIEDQRGNAWLESVHPDDLSIWRRQIDQVFPTEQPFELEFRLRRADGPYGSMICSARPFRDLQGGFAGYLCSCYDNTARRAAESALKESEERYQRITTNVPGMVFKLQRNSEGERRFLYVSYGSRAVAGLGPEVITADIDAFLTLLSANDRASLIVTLGESAQRLSTWVWSGRLLPADGGDEKWISVRAQPRRDELQGTVWDGVVFDDTQAHLAHLEIERSREEARMLSRHLQTVREEEKARIAREVHDELGSTLTGLKIDLDWLVEHQASPATGAQQKYRAMRALVDSAVAATRKIVTDLRPSVLDDLGLAAAMRWQISEYQRHSEMHFELNTPEPDLPIDRTRALALFRIFQETITNVSRHANATEVCVSLAQDDAAIVLSIRDNGVGVAPQDLNKLTSNGIRGMRERAEQIGGTLSVTGKPGHGTTVVIRAPQALAVTT